MIDRPIQITSAERLSPGPEASQLAMAAYDVLVEYLNGLDAAEWRAPTECRPWTVHDLTAHIVGAARGHASLGQLLRQAAYGERHKSDFGGSNLDAMNQRQILDHRDLDPRQLVAELQQIAPRAVVGRARLARWLGPMPIRLPDAGSSYSGMPRKTTLRELATVVLTRDVWMHRLDIARAIGREVALDSALDTRLITDLMAEWCLRHGQPVRITLQAETPLEFISGDGRQRLEMSAVDFVRVLAGREPSGSIPVSPLLQTKALF